MGGEELRGLFSSTVEAEDASKLSERERLEAQLDRLTDAGGSLAEIAEVLRKLATLRPAWTI